MTAPFINIQNANNLYQKILPSDCLSLGKTPAKRKRVKFHYHKNTGQNKNKNIMGSTLTC
jgi:hypothetical protein